MNKVVLGTVQFGLDYGVTNTRGQIPFDEAVQILNIAKQNEIVRLDTAAVYGESERILGEIGISDFLVYTKLAKIPDHVENLETYINQEIEQSLKRLKINSLEGIYFHDPKALHSERADEIYYLLEKLKGQRLFKKLGLSIYEPNEYSAIQNRFPIDLLQFPVNLFDQRFIDHPDLIEWKKRGIEIHARSIFLQGVLLKSIDENKDYFKRWNFLFQKRESWMSQENLSLLSSCLYPILSYEHIDKIIIGVDGIDNFKKILNSLKDFKNVKIPVDLKSEDPELIYPFKWN